MRSATTTKCTAASAIIATPAIRGKQSQPRLVRWLPEAMTCTLTNALPSRRMFSPTTAAQKRDAKSPLSSQERGKGVRSATTTKCTAASAIIATPAIRGKQSQPRLVRWLPEAMTCTLTNALPSRRMFSPTTAAQKRDAKSPLSSQERGKGVRSAPLQQNAASAAASQTRKKNLFRFIFGRSGVLFSICNQIDGRKEKRDETTSR